MNYLLNALGGETALTKHSPICAGRYNQTMGTKVSIDYRLFILLNLLSKGFQLYVNMTTCDSLIKEKCSFQLSENESGALDTCMDIMYDFRYYSGLFYTHGKISFFFRIKVNNTKNSTASILNCTTWAGLKTLVANVTACNLGNNSGKLSDYCSF